jgi:ADP-heptose:LPS heptosyltransferase
MVHKLLERQINVLQVGRKEELHIKNTFSLLGLTTPHQLTELVKKVDLVVTVDNFIMHVAHMVGTPAVVLWGPTSSGTYGYPEQIHIEASLDHCPMRDQCLGPGFPQNYHTACPLKEQHCMNNVSYDAVYKNIINMLI